MAAAIALLLVLPALAAVEQTQDGGNSETLTVDVQQRLSTVPADVSSDAARPISADDSVAANSCKQASDELTAAVDPAVTTRLNGVTYVSNSASVKLCSWTNTTDPVPTDAADYVGKSGTDEVVESKAATSATGSPLPANYVVVAYNRPASGSLSTGDINVSVNSPREPKAKVIGTLESGDSSITALGFWVVKSLPDGVASAAANNAILAQDGDILTITAGSMVASVTVDGKGPSFTGVGPADGTTQQSLATTVQFTVTDSASGIISALAANPDDAGIPRPVDTTTGDSAGSTYIDVNWGAEATTGNHELRGLTNWAELTKDHSYSLSYGVGFPGETKTEWYLEAWDRVFNYDRTDGDSDESGDQNYTFTIDRTAPKYVSAETGIGYDSAGSTEERDSSSIKVTFDGAVDSTRLRIDDFAVQGVDVVGIQHPNNKPKTETDDQGTADDKADDETTCVADKALGATTPVKGDTSVDPAKSAKAALCVDTTKVVYLALSQDLAYDATPDVTIYGGAIRDKTGNVDDQRGGGEADDGIRPSLTVTLDGDATGNLGQKKVDVTIEASEELGDAKVTVWQEDGKDSDGNPKLKTAGVVALEKDKAGDTWTGSLSRKAGEYLIQVEGTDKSGNMTSLKGKEKTAKSYGDAGLVAAIDTELKDATFSLNPKAGGKDTETESSNPFAIITFGMEKEEMDGYNEVTLTAITLNGEDVMGQVERASDTEFNIALFDLSVGSHELKYSAMDPAGNSDGATFSFKVNERSPYKVALRPGWNLISVPANPADTMLSAVMGDNPADQVVAYQDGEWLSAVKSDDGTWAGTLEDVMAGYGYWVATRTFQALEVSIPEANPGDSLLPTANVVEGWNLLGVMDPGQTAVPSGTAKCGSTDAADDTAGAQSAKDYFSGLTWSVAYGYDPLGRTWTKVNNVDTDCVKNGSGYWLYADEAGTLVP